MTQVLPLGSSTNFLLSVQLNRSGRFDNQWRAHAHDGRRTGIDSVAFAVERHHAVLVVVTCSDTVVGKLRRYRRYGIADDQSNVILLRAAQH